MRISTSPRSNRTGRTRTRSASDLVACFGMFYPFSIDTTKISTKPKTMIDILKVSKTPILYKGEDYQVTDVDKINDDEYLYEFMSRHGEVIFVTSEEYETDRK